jgi:hypothetical protein
MKHFEVKLGIHFPFNAEVPARSEEEAVKKAVDGAMDYLETLLQNGRQFAEFWEYDVTCDVDSISELEAELKR